MIYGCFYYKKNLTLGRVLVAKGIVVIVVNLFLNTLWLSMLGGKAFMAILPPRLLKNIIMWPIDSLVFFALAKTCLLYTSHTTVKRLIGDRHHRPYLFHTVGEPVSPVLSLRQKPFLHPRNPLLTDRDTGR